MLRRNRGKAAVEGCKSGFTLIELLVVIAIIALLAAILFPVFERARENAYRATCQSNLKQLGLGFIQYEQDFDERFPAGYYLPAGVVCYSGVNWGTNIFPYVKSDQLYLCPDDSGNKDNEGAGPDHISYAENAGLNMPGTDNGYYYGSTSELTMSSRTVELFECANTFGNLENLQAGTGYGSAVGYGLGGDMSWQENHGGGWYATGIMGGRTTGTVVTDPNAADSQSLGEGGDFQYPTGRHLDGSNFLMVDGHVKWYQGAQVSPGNAAYTGSYLAPVPAPMQAQIANNTYPTTSNAEGTEFTGPTAHAVTFSVW